MKDDETVRQVRLSIYQPFTDEETGHGTIPLLSEGVAAGQGSNIKTSEFLLHCVRVASPRRGRDMWRCAITLWGNTVNRVAVACQ